MVLVVDNYGSAANITAAMIRSLGSGAVVLSCSTDPRDVNIRDYSAVILTAGPGNLLYDALGSSLANQHGRIPLLGVCQGMEMIVRQHGGSVVNTGHVLSEDTLSHTGEGLFRGIGQRFRVALRRNHTIDKKNLPQVFETEAYSSDGAVQCLSIASERVYGTGFDPSNYRTEHGIKIFYNFLNLF
ncbi:MAG TPA: hypothetical protein PK514_06940 [Spirochaetota bacterium]|nr:hypothetical protein [Spirochaetota bacterium]